MLNFTKPLYPLLLSAVKSDPETAHRQMLNTLSNLETSRHSAWGSLAIKQLEKSFCLRNPRLQQNLWGLDFNNPFGLAAGFDKDGTAAGIWSSFGFGFAGLKDYPKNLLVLFQLLLTDCSILTNVPLVLEIKI